MTLSPNIVTSKLTIAQRWQKLYRTIFNAFLKRDFVHRQDFAVFEAKLNARLSTMEANMTAALAVAAANTSVAILSHIHPGAPPPAPGAVTGPGVGAPVVPAVPALTPPTNITPQLAEQQDAVQQATGPAIAPLGDGITPEAQIASQQALSNIGLT